MTSKNKHKPLSLEAHLKLESYKEGYQTKKKRKGRRNPPNGRSKWQEMQNHWQEKMPSHPQRKSLSLVARLPTRAKLQLKALPGEKIRGDPPRKITENMVSPQASPVQDQMVSPVPSVAAMPPLASVVSSPAQSTVQSVAAVSPLASVVTSPIQSMAVPHPASLAAVFKEMMDAAQVDGTIAPTMDEIEAENECRQAALDRPASPQA